MGTKLRRTVKVLGIALGALVLVLGLAYAFRIPLFGEFIRSRIESALNESLGGRFSVGSIDGTLLGDVRVLDVQTIEAPTDGAVRKLAFAEAAAEYDLLGLVFGDAPLAAVEAVTLRDLDLHLASTDEESELELPSLASPPLDHPLPRLDIGGRVELTLGGVPFRMERIGIERRDEDTIDIVVADAFAGDDAISGSIEAQIHRDDPTTLRWASTTRLGEIGLPEATYRTDGSIDARLQVAGGDVDIALRPESIDGTLRGLDFATLPAWLDRVLPSPSPLPSRGRVEGRAHVSGPSPLGLDAELEIRNLSLEGYDIRAVTLVANTDASGIIRIDKLQAEVGDATLEVRGGEVDPSYRYLLRQAATIRATVPSVAALVPDYERETHAEFEATKGEGNTLDIGRFRVRDELGTIDGQGRVTFPDDPQDAAAASVDFAVRGELPDLAGLGVEAIRGGIVLEGRIRGDLDALDLELERKEGTVSILDRALESLSLRGSLEALEQLRIDEATVSAGKTTARARGTIDARGESPELALDAEVVVQDIATWVPDDAIAGSARLEVRVDGTPSAPRVTGTLEAESLRSGETDIGSAKANLSFAEGRLALTDLAAQGEEAQLEGAAILDLDPLRLEVPSLVVALPDGPRFELREALEARMDERVIRVPRLSGRLDDATFLVEGLEVALDEQSARIQTLEGEREDVRVALRAPLEVRWEGDRVATDTLDVALEPDSRVQAALSADLAAKRLEVTRLDATHGEMAVRLAAPLTVRMDGERIRAEGLDARIDAWRVQGDVNADLDAGRAELERLLVSGPEVEAALASPAVVTWSEDEVRVAGLDVATLGGHVRGEAWYRETLFAELAARQLDLAPYLEGLEGRVDVDVRVAGETGAVALRAPELRWEDETFDVAATLTQEAEGGLRLVALRARDARGSDLQGTAVVPWRVGPEGLVRLDEVVPALRIEGTLPPVSSFVDVRSGAPTLTVVGDGDGLRGTLRVPDLLLEETVGPRNDGVIEFEVRRDSSTAAVRLADAGIARVVGEARLAGGLDWTNPEAVDALLDAALDGRVDVEIHDWEALRSVLPKMRQIGGDVRGGLIIGGTPRAPRLEGELTTEDVRVEISSALPILTDLDSRIVWRDERLTIESFRGELGYSPFELRGHAEGLFGGNPDIDARIEGQNVLVARSDAMRMRADLDVSIRGALDDLLTSGDVRVTSLLFVKPVSMSGGGPAIPSMGFQLFSVEDGPLSTMRFDLKIQADESIRIRNNLARGKVSADLALRGTGKRPEPVGRITVGQASIFLPATTLHLDGAEIIFQENDPFGPRLRATARSRASGYELGVRLAGRIPEVDVVVYSRPRLSDEDAMMLLAVGSTSGTAGVSAVTFQKAAEFFGKTLFSYARSTADPDARPFFDRFSMTVGREKTRRGNDTIETELGLTERIYLTVDRDRYDETNLGFVWRFHLP